MLEKYLTQVFMIATTAIMARVLTPAETGLFLVAQAFILLAESFRDFGVGSYLIQERDISRSVLRSSFTVTMLISLAMGVAIYFGADRIAAFYGQPELENLLIVATLGFIIVPFGTPIIALLRRDLQFHTLAWMNVATAALNAIVTISFGLAGFGAISYIWGSVIANAALALIALSIRPQFWMFIPSLAESRRLFSFGGIAVLVTVANIAYDLLPRLALGRILGFDAVGIFSRALTICQLPDRMIVQGLQPVVLPAMAARARAGQELKPAYLKGHQLMSSVQWPALLMLALLADPVVRVLLGPQWGEVPHLVRFMAFATMCLAPAFMTYPVLVAQGRIQDTFYASAISLPPSVLLILLVAPHGLDAVGLSLLVIAPFQMLVALLYIRRAIGLTFGELARASLTSIGITLLTGLIPGLIVLVSPHGFDLDWFETTLAILGAAVGWLGALRVFGGPMRDEIARAWSVLSSQGIRFVSQGRNG